MTDCRAVTFGQMDEITVW